MVERPLKLRELVLAADERRVQATGNELGPLDETREPKGAERLGLSLRDQRVDRFCFDRISDEAVRRLAQQRRAGLRALLETSGHVDGVTGRERVAFAGDDLAGVHADAALDPDVPVSLELAVELTEPGAHVRRRAHGP